MNVLIKSRGKSEGKGRGENRRKRNEQGIPGSRQRKRKKKGCLLDVRIFYLEHLGTEHSRAQGPWHYLHSATVATVAAKRHEILYPGIETTAKLTA